MLVQIVHVYNPNTGDTEAGCSLWGEASQSSIVRPCHTIVTKLQILTSWFSYIVKLLTQSQEGSQPDIKSTWQISSSLVCANKKNNIEYVIAISWSIRDVKKICYKANGKIKDHARLRTEYQKHVILLRS